MHLFADWSDAAGREKPAVLIVDHGLREGSRKDAALAAQWARDAGFAAEVLRWTGREPASGIEEKARAARYRLMGDWCAAHGVRALFLAHSEDDQAETFLLRLGRGSGVDGLSAMRPSGRFPIEGYPKIEVLRPLLTFRRGELRAFLEQRGFRWLEDPMNEDPRFARTRIREMLPMLEKAGVTVTRIAQGAAHLARAREALEAETEAFLSAHARVADDGDAYLNSAALTTLPREIGLRVLGSLLMRVSGAGYRPRFERLERLYEALTGRNFGQARTLHSCRIGLAPKREAVFGSVTLKISHESARKTLQKSSQNVMQQAAAERPGPSNSPQKGRMILS
jgi:tRNA(Ile)-lysidine synthase